MLSQMPMEMHRPRLEGDSTMHDTKLIKVKIDGIEAMVPEGSTILQAAEIIGIKIPTLCYDPRLSVSGACRICSVEVKGNTALAPACAFPAYNGIEVFTHTPKVYRSRKTIIELLLANHPQDCLICVRNGNCQLQKVAEEYGIREWRWTGEKRHNPIDSSTSAIKRQPDMCILCGKCVKVCKEVQSIHALDFTNRGFNTIVLPAFNQPLSDTVCILCGQCLLACPTAAIVDQSYTKTVRSALDNPELFCTVQVAPAIRASIGEEFGMPPGTLVTGKLVTALKRLGFNLVFDTVFGADLAVMEEGHELIERIQHDGPFPMFTSCSPGWIKFMEHFYPEFIPNMSSCKSPQQLTGIITKTYIAQKMNLDPQKIFNVSIMPCSAKKFEIERPEMRLENGIKEVDAVMTTRELARILKNYGINLPSLPNSDFDAPLGITSGAGVEFGVTGGMMEAALRTVADIISNQELKTIEYQLLRGYDGIKEGSVFVGNKELRVAVVHGIKNARKLLDAIKANQAFYHFVEVMACPGGCVGGGGQPYNTTTETIKHRISAIYQEDRGKPIRKAHENPSIQQLYREFLGEPLGPKSHIFLHTHYQPRKPSGI